MINAKAKGSGDQMGLLSANVSTHLIKVGLTITGYLLSMSPLYRAVSP